MRGSGFDLQFPTFLALFQINFPVSVGKPFFARRALLQPGTHLLWRQAAFDQSELRACSIGRFTRQRQVFGVTEGRVENHAAVLHKPFAAQLDHAMLSR